METQPVPAETEATATISLPETGEPLMVTGEDGIVYRVSAFEDAERNRM